MPRSSRTSRSDGAETRLRILEAAGQLFATKGFAEVTSKEIAAAAGVDLASINYHFGNRNGLYQAVLIEAHDRVIRYDFLEALEKSGRTPQEKLHDLIEGLVIGCAGNDAWHVRVLGRELLAPSSHFRILQQQQTLPKVRRILSVISEITRIPISDPALLRCVVSVGAPCIMLLVVGRHSSLLSEAFFATSRATITEHLYHFALGGLKSVAKAYTK